MNAEKDPLLDGRARRRPEPYPCWCGHRCGHPWAHDCNPRRVLPPADSAPFLCYPCARGDHDEHKLAWVPDIPCECPECVLPPAVTDGDGAA